MSYSNFLSSSFLQDPVTFSMEGIIFFFKDTMTFVYAIGFFVSWILFRCTVIFYEAPTEIKTSSTGKLALYFFKQIQNYASGVKHYTALEVVWTLVPVIILIIIAVPSFGLLYFLEEFVEPHLIIKVEGHQWYWHYSLKGCSKYLSSVSEEFDSYMVPLETLKGGQLRLLEVSKRLVLPTKTHVQVVATSVDVIHSWSVPSLGIKLDCCPGRLNESMIYLRREGTFYGQCSEICGVNHAFMPIVVESVSPDSFITFKSPFLLRASTTSVDTYK